MSPVVQTKATKMYPKSSAQPKTKENTRQKKNQKLISFYHWSRPWETSFSSGFHVFSSNIWATFGSSEVGNCFLKSGTEPKKVTICSNFSRSSVKLLSESCWMLAMVHQIASNTTVVAPKSFKVEWNMAIGQLWAYGLSWAYEFPPFSRKVCSWKWAIQPFYPWSIARKPEAHRSLSLHCRMQNITKKETDFFHQVKGLLFVSQKQRNKQNWGWRNLVWRWGWLLLASLRSLELFLKPKIQLSLVITGHLTIRSHWEVTQFQTIGKLSGRRGGRRARAPGGHGHRGQRFRVVPGAVGLVGLVGLGTLAHSSLGEQQAALHHGRVRKGRRRKLTGLRALSTGDCFGRCFRFWFDLIGSFCRLLGLHELCWLWHFLHRGIRRLDISTHLFGELHRWHRHRWHLQRHRCGHRCGHPLGGVLGLSHPHRKADGSSMTWAPSIPFARHQLTPSKLPCHKSTWQEKFDMGSLSLASSLIFIL